MGPEDEIIDGLNITLGNSLYLDERLDNSIHLAG